MDKAQQPASSHATTCPWCVRYGDAALNATISHRPDGTYESECRRYTGAHRFIGVWPEGNLAYQFAIDPHHPGLDHELALRQR